jgi:GNAT superfamily N-acetyltransferase
MKVRMLASTKKQRDEKRKEREHLKVGDRVAIVGPRDHLHVGDVEKVTPQRVTVAITDQWTIEYGIKDGRELSEFPLSRLRGLATPEEFEVSQKSIPPRKARWKMERVLEEQARTFRQCIWPQVIRDNGHRRKDEPGMHVDTGNYTNQLRYHDSEGILRGTLLHFRKADAGEKHVAKWDCHGDQYEQSGNVLIQVDPKRQRQGIASALLNEAFKRGWQIDLDKQGYTQAGDIFVRVFRKSSGC